ncbi:MAG TPA: molybdenum cofactor biosynthesis protein MoaE [Desulfobacteraceae bacterium]|nr:MAG: hypothetical protein B1H13_07455 [Desulfobacteraceae bacterium 4484_190.3]HDZ23114.1 molybdenum cofactor biosynthesis protein MoaE [Desulfobacteraceae bacterium]
MDLNLMIRRIKELPAYPRAGMIATHLGIVRGHSLNGNAVKKMEVSFDRSIIDNIISETKQIDGIIEVLVDFQEGVLEIGDEVMAVVVAGDTRAHVFPALMHAVDRMKSEATKKREIY